MANNQTANDLRSARKLIERPKAWLKVKSAEDEYGNPVSSLSHKARRFCALGAVSHAVGGDVSRRSAALSALRQESPRGLVTNFNDDPFTTHAEILALFDRAIAAAEG